MNVPESSPASPAPEAPLDSPRPPKIPATLFPPAARTARAVALLWVLPQCLLLLVNLHDWSLVKSLELRIYMQFPYFLLIPLQAATLACSIGLGVWLWLRPGRFPRALGLLPLLLGSAYLLFILQSSSGYFIQFYAETGMIPSSPWVLTQFILVMPGALFGAFRLLCPNSDNPGSRVYGVGRIVLTIILLSVAAVAPLFVIPMFAQRVSITDVARLWALVGYGLLLAISLLVTASILRLGISFYKHQRQRPAALFTTSLFIAVMAPLFGLWLNKEFPFPTSLQSPLLYILTLVNGAILLLPKVASPFWHRVIWLGQCLMLPFTLYFFAVYLPVLPMAPLAMIVLGAGLIIYTPALLLILHGGRILDGYRTETLRKPGRLPLILCIAAILTGPALYTSHALLDRTALRRALAHPEILSPELVESRPFLRSALTHYYDYRRGVYFPFVTEYYAGIVFKDLEPPADFDTKTAALLARPFPEPFAGYDTAWYYWGWNGISDSMFGSDQPAPPIPRSKPRPDQLAPKR